MTPILALDITGTPRQWISQDAAITYMSKNAVAWSLGDVVAKYRGGLQNDGIMSYLEAPSIIAIRGHGFNPTKHSKVVLSNRTLFGRDRMTCVYCGNTYTDHKKLSRDHIMPVSRGGQNTWMNVACSCKPCNSYKGNKTLAEAGLELLYTPYEPNHWENLLLQNRNVLQDQMDYLLTGIPKHSRILLPS
ncbi:hypothetical protein GHT06_001840 [Daphnia sinensis]|uniref:HNH nuclease domain-containing protein n=1 Tax=Daphnia sinensis TaxID=1820382 RepID=A0AAD5KTU6_9CRUS|nr:hypothetical protein GHT06_001840 [Daphnia sinensis]